MKKTFVLLAVLEIGWSLGLQAQILPHGRNRVSLTGQREGSWIIWYAYGRKLVHTKDSVSFFRRIRYRSGKPAGIVKDYFVNGKVAWQGRLISDQPEDVPQGKTVRYYENGLTKSEIEYDSGKVIAVKRYRDDGVEIFWERYADQGDAVRDQSDFRSAINYYEQAQQQAAREIGTKTLDYAGILTRLGAAYVELGNYAKAEPLYIDVLAVHRELLGDHHAMYAVDLNNLADVYESQGDYPKAEGLYLQAIGIDSIVLGKHDPDFATDLNNLAEVYRRMGNYLKAEPLYHQAAEIDKTTLGERHPDYAIDLNNQALLYMDMGNYSRAEPLYLQALQIQKSALGENHPGYANKLNNLAFLYATVGNYSKAELLYLEALRIDKTALGENHPTYATELNNLAYLYATMGNYVAAEPLYVQASQIDKIALGENHPAYAIDLNNLGILFMETGDYVRAEPLYLEALRISLVTLGDSHPAYAGKLNNLANLYTRMGNYLKAESLYREALDIDVHALGEDHPTYAAELNNLADLYSAEGEFLKAEPLQVRALQIDRAALGENHPSYASDLHDLALVYMNMRDYVRAEPLFLQAVEKTVAQIEAYFPGLSENEKTAFFRSVSPHFEIFNSFAVAFRGPRQTLLGNMYDNQLAIKALVLNASNRVKQRIQASSDEDLKKDSETWRTQKTLLSKVYLMELSEKQKKGIDEKKLEEDANRLEKELSLRSEVFAGANDKRHYTWKDVRKTLAADEAAIEIIRYREYDQKLTNAVRYAMLIVRPGTRDAPELVLLRDGNLLEGKYLRYYRNAIQSKVQDRASYAIFWAPVAAKLKGIKRIFLSPDGVYHLINLNTLLNPATKKFVLEEIDVRVLTNTRDLIRVTSTSQTSPGDVWLVGRPAYDNRTSLTTAFKGLGPELDSRSARQFSNMAFADLEGTEAEVRNIAQSLNGHFVVNTLLAEQATEEAVKKIINPRILHIATHGFFVDANRDSSGRMQPDVNPMLRSGIVLAGATAYFNAKEKPDTEDGILTAYESTSLNLDNTDLVVLSACETGLGELGGAEGLYGLQRALKIAGARTTLMSLWKIDDTATQVLMSLFYRHYVEVNDAREAFRKAQDDLKKKYQEAYYWGAFVMIGN